MFKSSSFFSMPSFFKGMGSALDLGATMTRYNHIDLSDDADAAALHSDWAVTGKDIIVAIDQYGVEYDKKTATSR